MRFEQFLPAAHLKPYIRYYVVSENPAAHTYKVLPAAGMVIGFQYNGQLAVMEDHTPTFLASAGITGIADRYRIFAHAGSIGTILVYFTVTGFAHFANAPANELFNLQVSLENIFHRQKIDDVKEKLAQAKTTVQRIRVVEQFLLAELKEKAHDKLIMEAVRMIYDSKGAIKISQLHRRLYISQSPFEKRFRKLVGTTPKKFASIVRFNTVLKALGSAKSLSDICYENNFFDQAHFIKDFRQFTGDTPEAFKRLQ
ncbi:AraC family transcriptional regulator [Panacibacter sp. DH6]|uniref:AraC family transcriptional regulator n=1 Tax=Panacibacter microcysteis TaxID=2793269 RepID=A0A931GWA0_9BACT|nr:helix-turn-helix domain-containing protein [Panacibacter microcysteis]MBG9377380.1 AraC family transcriptional regulator [Panacibacter microcysteis]